MQNHYFDKKSILVVDDDECTREVITCALNETGQFIIRQVNNGFDALDIFQKNSYDIVISDINMPGLSGIELLNGIMQKDPTTFVILITGYPSVDISVLAMKAGAVDFLTKPFRIDDLLLKVNLYLKERRMLGKEEINLKKDVSKLNDKIKELSTIKYIYESIENIDGKKDHIFKEIVALTSKVIGGETCYLVLFDEDNNEFHPAVIKNLGNNKNIKDKIPSYLTPILEKVVEKREAIIISSDNSSIICAPMTIRNKIFGVLSLTDHRINRKFSQQDLNYILNLATRASLNIENNILYESIYTNIIFTFRALVTSIHARDNYTEKHSSNVTKIAVNIAEALYCSKNEIESLKIAGMLHDIGKIAIPDRILLKTSQLTNEEYAIIKNHPTIGENILKPVMLLDTERQIIRHHHERWDGKGYPDGLKKIDIPLLSRILAVADSFDAMTSDRPYRNALETKEAVNELKRNCSKQFDKNIVDAFISIL